MREVSPPCTCVDPQDMQANSPARPQSPTSQSSGRVRDTEEDDLSDAHPVKRRRLNIPQTPTVKLPPFASPSRLVTPKSSLFPRAKARFSQSARSFEYVHAPPRLTELISTLELYSIPAKIYQVPYYSIESDAPERPREYAGLVYDLRGGVGISYL